MSQREFTDTGAVSNMTCDVLARVVTWLEWLSDASLVENEDSIFEFELKDATGAYIGSVVVYVCKEEKEYVTCACSAVYPATDNVDADGVVKDIEDILTSPHFKSAFGATDSEVELIDERLYINWYFQFDPELLSKMSDQKILVQLARVCESLSAFTLSVRLLSDADDFGLEEVENGDTTTEFSGVFYRVPTTTKQ